MGSERTLDQAKALVEKNPGEARKMIRKLIREKSKSYEAVIAQALLRSFPDAKGKSEISSSLLIPGPSTYCFSMSMISFICVARLTNALNADDEITF